MKSGRLKTEVLIIGGGATGAGIARDLALRGIACLLVERHDFNAGASGANHGLLHSGARYVSNDEIAARECRSEGALLKALAPQCIENTGGLFVAVEGDDERFVADFPRACARAGISAQALEPEEARWREPALSEKTLAAYAVEDGTVDPFRLTMETLAHAQALGAGYLPHAEVTGFLFGPGGIRAVRLEDRQSGSTREVEATVVLNAAGAWAAEVARMAGMNLELLYSKGTLLVTDHRMTGCVINRLRRPSDGDILVPGGTVSLLGTTSVRIPDLGEIRPTVEEVDRVIEEGRAMVPGLAGARYIRAYAGVRPLLKPDSAGDDREASRGFALLDHEAEGLKNLVTVAGGKLTTFRLMAEKAADLACRKLGITRPCRTRFEPLPATGWGRWSEPGRGPREWLQATEAGDAILCECELISRSAVDSVIAAIHKAHPDPDLREISSRTRLGKGACQGTFCGIRLTHHLYDRGLVNGRRGLEHLRAFLEERWSGERPVLWGAQLMQAELKEAIGCGLLGLELEGGKGDDRSSE